jgi:hypothetical protein
LAYFLDFSTAQFVSLKHPRLVLTASALAQKDAYRDRHNELDDAHAETLRRTGPAALLRFDV